jgi:hypothetical protein
MITQDDQIWLFIYFLSLSVLLLACFDASLRSGAFDLVAKTLLPLLLREVIAGYRSEAK